MKEYPIVVVDQEAVLLQYPIRPLYSQPTAKLGTKLQLETEQLVLESKPVTCHGLVGILKNDKLYLVKVSALQLKPKLNVEPKQEIRIETTEDEEEEEEAQAFQYQQYQPPKEKAPEVMQDLEIFGQETEEASEWLNSLETDMEVDDKQQSMSEYVFDLMQRVSIENVPLNKRILDLMLNAQAVTFSTLVRVLGVTEQALDYLEEIAVLIRGIWIIRSEHLYTGRTMQARKILLYHFLQNEYVKRADFVQETSLPPTMALQMLNELATKTKDGWLLKTPADLEFHQQHQELADRLQEDIEKQAQAQSKPHLKKENQFDLTQYKFDKSTPEEQAIDFLCHLTKNMILTKQSIFNALLQRQRDPDPRNLLQQMELDMDWLQAFLDEHCEHVKGIYFAKHYRHCVIDLFRTKKSLKKGDVISAWESQNLGTPPASHYTKIMQEIAVSRSTVWELKQPTLQ
ncbi:Sin-like protein conserved region-domain-containing protein [Gorgonomyces haynaldii]|nr:Sin-like protein conserved region-domain-containing protein [Gorgonomyces haynaldii]